MHELFKTYEFGPRLGIEVGAFDIERVFWLLLQQLNS